MKILNKTVHLGLIIAVASVISPLNVQSQELPVRGPIPFSAFDQDSSGFITQEEFDTVRAQRMEQKAADGRAMRGAASAPSFSDFDKNSDGQLSPDELSAGQQAQMEKRRSTGYGMGQGQGRGMGNGMNKGMNMPAFSDCDLNGDGKILEEEFYQARNKRMSERAEQGYQMRNAAMAPPFSVVDANGDGEISAEEFTAHQSQMMKSAPQQ